jgi:proteasome accessory factor C
VTVELQPWSAWVAEYYPTEGLVRHPDGSLTISLRVTDPAWLRGLLLRLRGGARVIEPVSAAAAAVEAAQEALDQYAAIFDRDAAAAH